MGFLDDLANSVYLVSRGSVGQETCLLNLVGLTDELDTSIMQRQGE